MYRNGNGVSRNKTETFQWFLKAVQGGLKEAQYEVGLIYYHGRGVKKDKNETQVWYRKAADQGHSGAKAGMGKRVTG